MTAVQTVQPSQRFADVAAALAQNARDNLARWCAAIAPPPPGRMLLPQLPAIAAACATIYVVVMLMFQLDVAASAWARTLPRWFVDAFEQITNFGLSGWFLFPSGFVLLCLAALISPALPRMSRGVLTALAARFGFLFLAVGVPGLFVTIVKRLIGRARPYVGGHDDPFAYMPFIWRPEYASMPSGHATTAASAAIAIGALWPESRMAMWLYAFIIMFSRVVVLAHHPSDVVAGALVGATGAYMVRRWFAGRHLVFAARDLRAFPGPSWRRIKAALRQAIAAASLYRRPATHFSTIEPPRDGL
jgi:membrane-associated phospholipid phosphatase